ncbi:MAG: oligosaccharide flippase family protein [Chitinispirillales bacterium]|jgi:O-antigen/teichoic acid export membrane protein|nr:oligosaccharide flippase family protein [Chitinispirillales bacterium]
MQAIKTSSTKPEYSLAARAASGSALLLARQVLGQGMNFCGIIFLARYLSIAEYGFFGIVFFLFAFIGNFGDVGLSASLLRQKEEPTSDDYASVFSAQLTLCAVTATLFAAISPLLCRAYNLPISHSKYFILISASLVVTAFRVIPTVKLERHLDFKWLSIIELIHTAVYNIVASVMAFRGYGPLSFTVALLCRVILGALLVNIVSRAPLRLNFSWTLIKKHLAFGLPFQIGVFVNTLKDSISPVIVGLILSAVYTGKVNMASTIATFPVLLLGILGRLFFPAFSRTLGDKEALEKIFALAIRVSNALIAPLAIFVLLMVEPFTLHVFGNKWVNSEVMELCYLLWLANLFLPTLMVCTSLLYAFGKSKTVLKFNLVWMFLTLGLGTPLIFIYGAKGFGFANIVVNIATLMVVWKMRAYINCNIIKNVLIGWFPAILFVWFPLVYKRFFEIGILHLFLCAVSYFILSAAMTYLFSRKEIDLFMKTSKN